MRNWYYVFDFIYSFPHRKVCNFFSNCKLLGAVIYNFFSNCTLFLPIRSTYVSNLMNHIITLHNPPQQQSFENGYCCHSCRYTCCHCKGTWTLETLRKQCSEIQYRSSDMLEKSKLLGTAMAIPCTHDLNGPTELASCANLNLGDVSLSHF